PPVITKLKNLYLTTPMNQAVIAPGNTPALRQAAKKLAAKTGAKIADPATVAVPLKTHVIALGNRANNALIDKLYMRSYCYTDLTYPGKGGYELRSIHNPTGGGFNVLLCGGSDDAGAVQAAEMLAKEPVNAGFLLKVKTPGFDKSKIDPADPEHYHLIGTYYGWNYISGVLALFYQTGDTFYAKEFLRLAFPDAKAIRDFKRFNAESIELPNDPLAGPYHYAAHHMILLWDLVEEHPFFTDKQRLDITNAFVRQWKHHVRWTRPADPKSLMASSRHGQWAEISNYALGRYFQKDYPAPAWKDAVERAEACFDAAGRDQATIYGEGGIVPWFVSGAINPAAQFFALSGGRPFNPKGGFAAALRFLDTQWDGSAASEVLGTAYRQTFYLTAEHTGDGKYLWYANMLKSDRKGVYKLGAGFTPTGKIAPRKPVEMMNRWTVAEMPLGKHRQFGLNAPLENCFNGLAWRDTLDTTGDWISFNCFNERYRTPFKLLSIYGLRLNGKKILSGFGNYVQPLQNGAGSKAIPILGQVYNYGNAGESVFFSGGVPEYGFASWQRDLLLRKRSFVLLADTLKPFSKGPELTMLINFEAATRMMPDDKTPNRIKIAGKTSGEIIPARAMALSAKPQCGIFSGARNTHFETAKVGDRAVLTFTIPREITCEPALLLNDNTSRCGSVNIYLDGKKILSGVPHYSQGTDLDPNLVPLGPQYFTPGKHTIEVEVASRNTSGTTNYIGVGNLTLGAKDSKVAELYLTTSAGEAVSRSATNAAVKRTVPGAPEHPVTTFSLFREETQPVTAITESDRAAWFLLPEPMLVFCGTRQHVGSGTLVLLEKTGITGQGITELGNSLKAAQPVMLDWVFGKSLAVSGKPGTGVVVNGRKYTLDAAGNLTVSGVNPEDMAEWQTILKNPPSQAAAKTEAKVAVTRAKTTNLAHLKGNVSFLTETGNGYLAAVNNVLYVLDRQFQTRQKLEMSAKILSAVAADGLIAVGAINDELAAFDPSGKK
ncbi:MAG: DUF4397 domain-containing protein, partial [Lentisphaeria bacterium]|nr:DUF4397 domain-containing protein [Lentisphaeria bacterium]